MPDSACTAPRIGSSFSVRPVARADAVTASVTSSPSANAHSGSTDSRTPSVRTLADAGAHAAAGGRDAILAAAQSVLNAHPEIEVDYLALTGRQLEEPPEKGDGRLLVAARVGAARLIDNVGVAIGTGFAGRDPEQTSH